MIKVTKLKMYPYFDLAHAALCCLAVREDLSSGTIIAHEPALNPEVTDLYEYSAKLNATLHMDTVVLDL